MDAGGKDNRTRDVFLGLVAVAAAHLGDADLFAEAIENVTSHFVDEIYEMFGRILCLQDLVVREDE